MTLRGWHIGRVTIEALSPMSCASGEQSVTDTLLVRDASGLPMIPGATLQGISRWLWERRDRDTADKLFGSRGSGQRAGRIMFSHAAVHDKKGEAVTGLVRSADPLLRRLMREAPASRDHVQLNDRHVAAHGAKFDRAAVPRGTRFSFEVLARDEGDISAETFHEVLTLARHPLFRPGGASRRGYGRVAVCAISSQFFGPSEVKTMRDVRESPPSSGLEMDLLTDLRTDDDLLEITFALRPVNPWRTGSKGVAVRQGKVDYNVEAVKPSKPVDSAPTRDPGIIWDANDGGQWIEPTESNDFGYVLAGSSLRGTLAHRTLFHWNRANGGLFTVPDTDTGGSEERQSEISDQFRTLAARRGELETVFGSARDQGGQASPLFVDDVVFAPSKVLTAAHSSIDRFTGGVRAGILFSEELVGPDTLSVRIIFDRHRGPVHETVRDAFCRALADLSYGRLALGAKSYGFCALEGEISWSGAEKPLWCAAWKRACEEEAA